MAPKRTYSPQNFESDMRREESKRRRIQENARRSQQEVNKSIDDLKKQEREMGYRDSSMTKILEGLNKTIASLSEGTKKITGELARTSGTAISQISRAVGEDFKINKTNLMKTLLIGTSPVIGYYLSKVFESNEVQKSMKNVGSTVGKGMLGGLKKAVSFGRKVGEESLGSTIAKVYNIKRRMQHANKKGVTYSDIALSSISEKLTGVMNRLEAPKMAVGGYVKKGGLAELHPAEVVVPIEKIMQRLDESNKNLRATADSIKQIAYDGKLQLRKEKATSSSPWFKKNVYEIASIASISSFKMMQTYSRSGDEKRNKMGFFGGIFDAYKRSFGQFQRPFQERLMKTLLSIQSVLGASIGSWRQFFQEFIANSPFARAFIMLGRSLSSVFIKPFINIIAFPFRKRGGYGKDLPKTKSPLLATSQTLGLMYVNFMWKFDNILNQMRNTNVYLSTIAKPFGGDFKNLKDSVGTGRWSIAGLVAKGVAGSARLGWGASKAIGRGALGMAAPLGRKFETATDGIFSNKDLKIKDLFSNFFKFRKKRGYLTYAEKENIKYQNRQLTVSKDQLGIQKKMNTNIRKSGKGIIDYLFMAGIMLSNLIGGFISGGLGMMSSILNILGLGGVGLGISKMWKGAKGGAKKVGASVLGKAKSAGKFAVKKMPFLKTLGKLGLRGLGGAAGAVGGLSVSSILKGAGFAEGAIDAYSGIQRAEEYGVNKVLGAIAGFFSSKKAGVKGAVKGSLKGAAIGSTIGSVVPIIGTGIGGALGAIAGGIMGFIGEEKIAKSLQSVWDKVKDFAVATWGIIKYPFVLVKETWNKFKYWLEDRKYDLSGYIVDFQIKWDESFGEGSTYHKIMTNLKKTWDVVVAPIKYTWNKLTNLFSEEKKEEINNKITGWVNDIKNIPQDMIKGIKVWLATKTDYHEIKQSLSDSIQSIKNIPSNIFNSIKNYIQEKANISKEQLDIYAQQVQDFLTWPFRKLKELLGLEKTPEEKELERKKELRKHILKDGSLGDVKGSIDVLSGTEFVDHYKSLGFGATEVAKLLKTQKYNSDLVSITGREFNIGKSSAAPKPNFNKDIIKDVHMRSSLEGLELLSRSQENILKKAMGNQKESLDKLASDLNTNVSNMSINVSNAMSNMTMGDGNADAGYSSYRMAVDSVQSMLHGELD